MGKGTSHLIRKDKKKNNKPKKLQEYRKKHKLFDAKMYARRDEFMKSPEFSQSMLRRCKRLVNKNLPETSSVTPVCVLKQSKIALVHKLMQRSKSTVQSCTSWIADSAIRHLRQVGNQDIKAAVINLYMRDRFEQR
eukprot:Colp12_sorted_trinity150504_noHs@30462